MVLIVEETERKTFFFIEMSYKLGWETIFFLWDEMLLLFWRISATSYFMRYTVRKEFCLY